MFRNFFRLQASGFRLQASGFRLQTSGVLGLFFVSLVISPIAGCAGKFPDASQATTSNRPLNEIRYDGGFVFADRQHVVGIDVAEWEIASLSQIQRLQISCECVQVHPRKIDDGPKKIILFVQVAADAKLSRSTSLAVLIEAILADGSKKLLSFEFTHVAISALN